MAWEMMVKNELRPCYVIFSRDDNPVKALFHGWCIDGTGIVELENGTTYTVRPGIICFEDSACRFNEFVWDKEGNS